MKKTQKYHKQKKGNWTPMLVGMALIVVGVVLFGVLKGAEEASASDDSRSVVPMAVEYSAPTLALTNVNGNQESLDGFLGKVLLVNNWATWCPPCKAEMPSLQKYYEAHQDEGFVIIAVDAGDPKPSVEQFVKDYGLTFHVWLDPEGEAIKAFKNGGLPNSYVIDREGIVRYAWTGEISLAMLEEYVTPVIQAAQ